MSDKVFAAILIFAVCFLFGFFGTLAAKAIKFDHDQKRCWDRGGVMLPEGCKHNSFPAKAMIV